MDKRRGNNRLFWARRDLVAEAIQRRMWEAVKAMSAVIAAAGGRAVPEAGRAMTSATRTCSDTG